MIFAGPSAPKFIAEAWVASEKVGEGGPGEEAGFEEPNVSVRSERGRRGAIYCKVSMHGRPWSQYVRKEKTRVQALSIDLSRYNIPSINLESTTTAQQGLKVCKKM